MGPYPTKNSIPLSYNRTFSTFVYDILVRIWANLQMPLRNNHTLETLWKLWLPLGIKLANKRQNLSRLLIRLIQFLGFYDDSLL